MTRRTATFLWAALLATPLAFAAVASAVEGGGASPHAAGPVLWIAVAASALNLVLSRALPPRLGPSRASDPEAVAFTRLVVAFALCDAAALAPAVAYVVTRDARLLGLLAIDLLALVVLYPSGARWDSLRPEPGVAPAPRGVR